MGKHEGEAGMEEIPMYHEGSRQLQDRFATRPLADRLAEVLARNAFTDDDRAFIESRPLFFMATADAQGRPDCSYKGGRPGFVRVVDPHTLAFPSYDGNGMFKSLGNVLLNPQVGLLFIDFESPRRLRVNGRASVHEDDPLLPAFAGAQLMVRRTCGGDLSELSALHPPHADRRGIALRAVRGPHSADPEVEAASRVPRGAAAR